MFTPFTDLQQFSETSVGQEGCIIVDLQSIEFESYFNLAQSRALPAILLTENVTAEGIVSLIRHGAFCVLGKPLNRETLVNHIHKALNVADNWFRSYSYANAGHHLIKNLTPREHQIFRLLIHGNTNKSIAETLGISARTVEVHRSHIMSKLQTKNLYDLIILSIATGEIQDWRLESIQFANE